MLIELEYSIKLGEAASDPLSQVRVETPEEVTLELQR